MMDFNAESMLLTCSRICSKMGDSFAEVCACVALFSFINIYCFIVIFYYCNIAKNRKEPT